MRVPYRRKRQFSSGPSKSTRTLQCQKMFSAICQIDFEQNEALQQQQNRAAYIRFALGTILRGEKTNLTKLPGY